MKKILFTIIACFTLLTTKAQTENKDCKIRYTTTIGTGLSISTPSSTPILWQFIGYYNFTERWSAGAGTGLSFYEKMLIPLFGNIKYQIGRTRKFTPYAELGMGYSFAPQSNANGGLFINPSFGLLYPLKNKMSLQLAIGYEIQKLERLKTHTDNHFSKEFAEKLNHNSISIKLGFTF